MAIFRVLASRTELCLIEAYVKATDVQEAEAMFYGALEEEELALSGVQDFAGSDTEIDSIELLPLEHEPVPSPSDRALCLYCGRTVRWTGRPAEESPTGYTIPGPWITSNDRSRVKDSDSSQGIYTPDVGRSVSEKE